MFSLDINICLYQNISTHSITECKTHHSAIMLYYCNVILSHDACSRRQHAVQKKTGEFSLHLPEMRPVTVITSIMCNLNDLSVTGVTCVTKFNTTILRCVKFTGQCSPMC